MPEVGMGGSRVGLGQLFADLGLMVVEGRLGSALPPRRFKEGPHCPSLSNSPSHHVCSDNAFLCERAEKLRRHMALLVENSAPMCIEVLLCPDCPCGTSRATSSNICQVQSSSDLLVEQWTISIVKNTSGAGGQGSVAGIAAGGSRNVVNSGAAGVSARVMTGGLAANGAINVSPTVGAGGGGSNPGGTTPASPSLDERVLLQAVRSQLHFSQLAAWWALGTVKNVAYRLCHPPVGCAGFSRQPVQHDFPVAKSADGSLYIKVSLKSLPRLDTMPQIVCSVHHATPQPGPSSALTATVTAFKSVFAELGQCLLDPPARIPAVRNGFTVWRDSKANSPGRRGPSIHSPRASHGAVLDDRLLSGCQHIGKHRCEDEGDGTVENGVGKPREATARTCYSPVPTCSRAPITTSVCSPCSSKMSSSKCKVREAAESDPCSSNSATSLKQHLQFQRSPVDEVFHVLRCQVFHKHLDEDSDESEEWDDTERGMPASVFKGRIIEQLKSKARSPSSPSDLPLPTATAKHPRHKTPSEACCGGDTRTVPPTPLSCRPSSSNPLKRKWGTLERGRCASKKLLAYSEASPTWSPREETDLAQLFTRLDISHPPSSSKLPGENQDSKTTASAETASQSPANNRRSNEGVLSIPGQNRPYWLTDSSSEETEGESPVSAECRVLKAWLCPGRKVPVSSSPDTLVRRLLERRGLKGGEKFSRPLLGNFEENILGGRLRPVSVIEGFTADLGASGTFCPQHLKLPVSMKYYSIEPHSAPTLGEIELSKKGYTIPPSGTVQVTLLNTLGTVVKMFVVPYNLSDMPPNCHTFVRQRSHSSPQSSHSYYTIHLRIRSSKSGRICLWGEVKVLLCRRQYDVDSSLTATDAEGVETITITPTNPRYASNK